MRSQVVGSVIWLVTLAIGAGIVIARVRQAGAEVQVPPPRHEGSAKQSVVVELFTSEGCSSCPPADALLKQFSQEQPVAGALVIALEEHVDYWNHLGWADPFSTRDFSARQEEYAAAFRNRGVYTPQMIVDGASEVVGSNRGDAEAAIHRAAAEPKISILLCPVAGAKDLFEVRLEHVPSTLRLENSQLWIAVTEAGLQTSVTAGENSGEKLQHADVVRWLHRVEGAPGAQGGVIRQVSVPLKPEWKLPNVRVVAFVVDRSSHHIIGAAAVSPQT